MKKKKKLNEDNIGSKKKEFYIVPLKDYQQKSGVIELNSVVWDFLGNSQSGPLAWPLSQTSAVWKNTALMSIFSFDFQHEKMRHCVLWHVILRYIQILYVSLLNPVAAVIQPQKSETESWILWWPSYGHILKVINIFYRVYIYSCSR